MAHWLAEEWLTNGNPYQWLGSIQTKDGFEIEITEEMISYVEEYVCWVSTTPGRHYVEVKVDLSAYTPEPSFGTADHIFAEPGHLTVTDLKYGKVMVFAKENEQGMAYALGAFDELDWLYDFQTITIRISQPRRDHFDEWTCTRGELLAFAEKLRTAAHEAWNPDAPYRPHPDACEYCPARFDCPALADVLVRTAQASFPDLDDDEDMSYDKDRAVAVIHQEMISEPALPEYSHMPLDQLARIYLWRPVFDRWFREAYDYLIHQMDLGHPVQGQKLGMGRAGNRAWIDKQKAIKYLKQNGVAEIDLYDHKLASPAQASALLRLSLGGTIKANDARLDDFVYKPPGKLTMIPADDTRRSIASAVSAFDDVEED